MLVQEMYLVMTRFCDCTEDGYCNRYAREMHGRFREICAGINCDLGTAAAFREQWLQESSDIPAHLTPDYKPTTLLLITDQAPGDAVAMTAAIYSLHRAHPGKYRTAVESPYPDVFAHNPDVVAHFLPGQLDGESNVPNDMLRLHMHYPAIHQSNKRAIHFMQGWCEHLSHALGVNVPLLTNRPHLYFDEPATHCGASKMWIICSGGKRDLTNKLWGYHNYQSVVNQLHGKVMFTQVGGRNDDHPRLNHTYDMVGTTLRGLFNLVRRARGVVCGVSLIMHVAAALGKPAIVIAGGREPVAWNAYPSQQYLHTVGALPCSSPQGDTSGACWRSRVQPLGDSTVLDEHPCQRPVNGLPECMRMIAPARVAELVMAYNRQYE